MAKTQKVQMPAGIRNKLMAAVCMLLVSSIMMVSTTYAWFTLSTAPEVTGITTSVGANGNLEMALLTTDTFKDLSTISSAVGNSSAVAGAKAANTTWGNLVDLSDASYGLQNINLLPARLSFATANDATKVNVNNLLLTPTYGKDGRVATVDGKTYTAVYDTTGWKFDENNQTYGVRAIGANENLTAQQAGLIAAKAAYTSNLNSAKSAVQTALSTNGGELASAITTMAMNSTDVTLTAEQQQAIANMVNASSNALDYIDAAYKQVLLAYAASAIKDATLYESVAAAITEATTYTNAKTQLETLVGEYNASLSSGEAEGESQTAETITLSVPSGLTTAVDELTTQQKGAVSTAQNSITGENPNYKTALTQLVDTTKVTVNDYTVQSDQDNSLMVDGNINSGFMNKVIADGGAIVKMPDDSGVFAYVGSVAGNYSAGCKVTINYKNLNLNGMNATMKTTATVDTTVNTAINGLEAAESSSAETFLSDTYGYALDFAFRTNAAGSYLQLQTDAAQRVYGESESTATMGAGSTMTFKASTNDAGNATLTDDQVKDLMGAIRVAFIDPGAGTTSDTAGTVYGVAKLENIEVGSDGFIGKLCLQNVTFDETTGMMQLTTRTDDASTTDKDESKILMSLDQSIAKRLTVVVYLDGDLVDNGDVANAAQSLVGSLNLQFSSSATLIPMKNTALQNLTITYAEMATVEYKAGVYTFNDVLYAVDKGYKIYQGSDNVVYFSNDETNYTKLTIMNASTAMSPVTVSVTGESTVTKEREETLTAQTDKGTIGSVAWSSDNTAVATVTESTSATINVTGVAAGTANITANITLNFGSGDTATTKSMSVVFPVTVTEPTTSETNS